MKLSISNIAWKQEQDIEVYQLMKEYGFTGLEIAPTRIFLERPYEQLEKAKRWAEDLKSRYGFDVPSMQSIWFGRSEKLFGTVEEREALVSYTKMAVDFAESVGCRNLVFGCPKNRIKSEEASEDIAVEFFKTVGDYASTKNIKIGIEANPEIYGTNYLNATEQAIRLIKMVGLSGVGLNLDFGTIIHNGENLDIVAENISLISHVHISEPNLAEIQHRPQHKELARLLKNGGYNGFVSVEMKSGHSIERISEIMSYISSVF